MKTLIFQQLSGFLICHFIDETFCIMISCSDFLSYKRVFNFFFKCHSPGDSGMDSEKEEETDDGSKMVSDLVNQ